MVKLTQIQGGYGRNILGAYHGLTHDQGDLIGKAPANASDDLETNPLPDPRVQVEGIDQTAAEKSKHTAGHLGGNCEPSGADEDARRDHGNGDGNDEWKIVDTRHGGTGIVDTLEVDGEIVDRGEVRSGEEDGENTAHSNDTLLDEPRHNHGSLFLEDFPRDEDSDDDNATHEETDDGAAAPRLSLATVFHSQDIRDEGTHHQGHPQRIHLQELLLQGGFDGLRVLGGMEEKDDDCSSEATNRKTRTIWSARSI